MEEQKSKSQKKRDAEALRKIGVALIDLSKEKLADLPLPTNLHQAILEAKNIKSHGATRRQAQLIGKLMREAESDNIIQAYEALMLADKAQTTSFHEVEKWRDRLLNDYEAKEALTEFIGHYQPTDVQQLRQLVKKASEEQRNQGNTGAAKALFRFLRSYLI